MMDPRLSIVSVNYNTTADTIAFIESCRLSDYSHFEIVIVDNASSPPFPEIEGRDLTIIRSPVNLGFAGGNNLGIDAATGDYIFFLNSDTLVTKDLFSKIVDFLRETPDAGAVTPKILYADGVTIQFAGSGSISTLTGRGRRIGRNESDAGQYDTVYQTELVHGAAFAVPRKVISEVGKMPQEFFLYYEEHDWAEQIKRAGYKLYYNGKASIIHKESKSVGGSSPLKTYYMARNRILFIKRNSQGIARWVSLAFVTFISLPVNLCRFVVTRKLNLAKAYWKGFVWHFKKRD